MNTHMIDAAVRAMRSMDGFAPQALLEDVQHHIKRTGTDIDEPQLAALITDPDPNGQARVAFHIQLSRWDATDDADWTQGTPPFSQARRDVILGLLELGSGARDSVNTAFPVDSGPVIISQAEWDPWYTEEYATRHGFYWPAYRRVLEKKIGGEATNELDRVTHEVVRRLADPTRKESYQSKGLVVGHVQSGKTANFTGVLAKAVDAGYRLVIVLTGTIELLRGQTQRRLDMELVGEENILGGRDRNDADQIRDVDYAGTGDKDWANGKFLRHGKRPKDMGFPSIRRLTDASGDYKSLKNGLGYLDYRETDHLADPAKRLNDETNLFGTDIRLAVVKKNSAVLAKLVKDLRAINADLDEIPTLIIDDEADQASINTRDPRKSKAASTEDKERTKINGHIAEILREMPRAQYIAYTATPFANVFVDPDDEQDIFPKDFIISLTPPSAYMGGRDFHDLARDTDQGEQLEDDAGLAISNERAYVRDLVADKDDDDARRLELRGALDAFVLSGALKLHRKAAGMAGDFRHHTMLVHESVQQREHAALAEMIREVWSEAGYSTPAGLQRLQELWKTDFLPVTQARTPNAAPVAGFGDLHPHIGEAVSRIRSGYSPVIVVNGAAERDYAQNDLDFQADDVWKILVGGAKLSRGFTVEGLTVTYYTRKTTAADTLMQMGRWFGYRPGYRDLVRLYIGRNVPGPRKGTTVDLYKAFEAIVRDEEEFREQLRQYQGLDDEGRPKIRPIDVPPLVFQSLPWITPTGRNKMFNARLTLKGEGGKVKDHFQQPRRDPQVNRRHFHAVQPLLDSANRSGSFFNMKDSGESQPGGLPFHSWQGRYGVVSAEEMLTILREFTWAKNYSFEPTLEFIQKSMDEATLEDWAVIVPDLSKTSSLVATRYVEGRRLDILRRTRRPERDDMFSGSSPRQRNALEIISGGASTESHPHHHGIDVALRRPEFQHIGDHLMSPRATRGALLLTFAADDGHGTAPRDLPDDVAAEDIATLFSLAMPYKSAPGGRAAFTVKFRDGRASYDPEEDIQD